MSSAYLSSVEERQRDCARRCIDAYAACRQASRIVASNLDDTAKPSIRWTPDGVHYQRDIELAVTAALPRPELRSAFWRYAAKLGHGLISHDQPLDRTTSTALTRAGKKLMERSLSPNLYFKSKRIA